MPTVPDASSNMSNIVNRATVASPVDADTSRAGQVIAERQGVFISGGTIHGPVVGINQGQVNYYNLEISYAGTKLGDGPAALVTVLQHVMRVPRPPRTFYDRLDALASLELEMQPGGGAWLYGSHGCGLTTLLRKAANSSLPQSLANGAIYLDGALVPEDCDEIVRDLFVAYHDSPVPIAVDPETAKSFLAERKALFILDRLPLAHDELIGMADTLRQGAVLIAAEGPAPDILADMRLRGLPRADSIRLCAQALFVLQPTEQLKLTLPVVLFFIPTPTSSSTTGIVSSTRWRITSAGQAKRQ